MSSHDLDQAEETAKTHKPYYNNQNKVYSVFPPCAFCGAQYEAHETVDKIGARGHTINAPGRPQHGQFHYFTPLSPE